MSSSSMGSKLHPRVLSLPLSAIAAFTTERFSWPRHARGLTPAVNPEKIPNQDQSAKGFHAKWPDSCCGPMKWQITRFRNRYVRNPDQSNACPNKKSVFFAFLFCFF